MPGKTPSSHANLLHRLGKTQLAGEILHDLLVAHCLGSCMPQSFPPLQKRLDLFHQALVKHPLDTGLYPIMQDIASMPNREHPALMRVRRPIMLHLPVTDRLPGKTINFQGADDSPPVIGMQLVRRDRVHHLQPFVKLGGLDFSQFRLDLLAKIAPISKPRLLLTDPQPLFEKNESLRLSETNLAFEIPELDEEDLEDEEDWEEEDAQDEA